MAHLQEPRYSSAASTSADTILRQVSRVRTASSSTDISRRASRAIRPSSSADSLPISLNSSDGTAPSYNNAVRSPSAASVLRRVRPRSPTSSRIAQRYCPHLWCLNSETPISGSFATHKCTLSINNAPEDALRAFFAAVPGLGHVLAHRVSTALSSGPFSSDSDFDRRVPRLSYARLCALSAAQGIAVVLGPANNDNSSELSPDRGSVAASIADSDEARAELGDEALRNISEALDENGDVRTESSVRMRIATWNAGHMSLNSRHLAAKTAHLVRFVADARELAALALQEVYEGVATYIARTLCEQGLGEWRALEGHAQLSAECLRQAFVYNASLVDGSQIGADAPAELLGAFKRPPAVALFRKWHGNEWFYVVNVHLSTRETEHEVEMLSPLLRYLETRFGSGDRETDHGIRMCVGDFNANADNRCFEALRADGFRELVVPPNCISRVEAELYLTTPTTVGNNWYDNVWTKGRRTCIIENAWCFDFGGRCPALRDTSGYDYAGYRRSLRSDHFALVAEFNL